jgi:hypothetical protein
MAQIINYFENDPLRLLYLIGGTGGIWFWVQEWRKRVRIRVTMLNGMLELKQSPTISVKVKVEAVNLGNSTTSVEAVVRMVAWTARDRRRVVWSLNVVSPDRTLEPHKPKIFELSGNCEASYPFTWYRAYTFRVTKGSDYTLRTLSASDKQLGFFRFFGGLLLFRVFGYVPGKA